MRARATSMSSTSMSGRVRKPVGACAVGRGLEREERAAAIGRELDPVGRGLDHTDAEHGLPELGQFGRIGGVHHHRPQPSHRLCHLAPPAQSSPGARPSGHPMIVRGLGSSVSGPWRPTTTCSPRRSRRHHGRRTTPTSSPRTRCSANRGSTRRAARWSRRPGPASPSTRAVARARRARHRRRRDPLRRRRRSSRAHPTRDPARPGRAVGHRARPRCSTRSSPARTAGRVDRPRPDGVARSHRRPAADAPVGAATDHRVVNERYRAEVPTLLAGSLAHDLLWSGPGAGQYEEVVLHALVALVHLQLLARAPGARAHRHRARAAPELARHHAPELASPGPAPTSRVARARRPGHHPRWRARHADPRLLEHPVRRWPAGRGRRTGAARRGAARASPAATAPSPLRYDDALGDWWSAHGTRGALDRAAQWRAAVALGLLGRRRTGDAEDRVSGWRCSR